MVWRISAAEARAYWEVATAATLEGCARELESLDAAPQASKAAGEEPQPVAVVRDHPEDYGTLIDALVALPVAQLYARPRPAPIWCAIRRWGRDTGRRHTTAASICSKSREPSTPSSCKRTATAIPPGPAHTGMRVDYRGLLSQARDGYAPSRAWPRCCASCRTTCRSWASAGTTATWPWWTSCCSSTASNRKRAKRWPGRPTWLKTAKSNGPTTRSTRGRAARRSDPVAITATLKRAMRFAGGQAVNWGRAHRAGAPAPQTGASRSPGMPHMPSSRPNTGGASECFAPAWPTCSTTPWIQPGARIFSASSRPPEPGLAAAHEAHRQRLEHAARTVRLR